VIFNASSIKPVRIAGFSKAVAVPEDVQYGISATLIYADETTDLMTANFTTGSHDFEFQQYEMVPQKLIQKAVFNITFMAPSGEAYFSYVALQEKTQSKLY
jgi:hypothetical protein